MRCYWVGSDVANLGCSGEIVVALVNGPIWLGECGERMGRESGWKMELPAWNEWMVEFLFCNRE